MDSERPDRDGQLRSFERPRRQLRGHRTRLPMLFMGVLLLATGCVDNATKLSLAMEREIPPYLSRDAAWEGTVLYSPKARPRAPYTLIFFPDRTTYVSDLVARGLTESLARRIFTELSYVGVGDRAMLVVVQDGARLSFTTHWSQFASVDQVVVLQGQGRRRLVLADQNGRVTVIGLE